MEGNSKKYFFNKAIPLLGILPIDISSRFEEQNRIFIEK